MMRLAARSPLDSLTEREARIRTEIGDPAGLSAPGYAVGVFRAGQVAEIVTVGARDVDARLPIDEHTQFYVGSVSKQFTALALIRLVVAGQVSLDDEIHAYLPEMPRYDGPVTVGMLLHHTAGIRESLALLSLAGFADFSAPSRREALDLVLRQPLVDFAPGSRCEYSNGGYLLLSEIVERVAGEPFADHVNGTILAPLGMSRSYILAGERPSDDNVARGYRFLDGHACLSDRYPLFGGSGGLITTLADLARYDHDIDSGHQIWTPEITKGMLEPGRLADGDIAVPEGLVGAYASGLMIGPSWISHGGAALGMKANYARLPERRIGLAILCNRGDVDLDERANAIAASMKEALPPVVETTPQTILGRYASKDLDVEYELVRKGGRLLIINILSGSGETMRQSLLLTRMSDGSYMSSDIRLVLDSDNRSFALHAAQVSLTFERMDRKPSATPKDSGV